MFRKKLQILMLDEATAAIDYETGTLIRGHVV